MVLSYSQLYSTQNPDSEVTCTSDMNCDASACTNESCNKCYKYEYCKNKERAMDLISGKQLGQMQENRDVNVIYNGDYIKSINLILGIIGISSFIFYNK